MPDETPMRRIPEKKIWQTIDSMKKDLSEAHETMCAAYAQMQEGSTFAKQDFLHAIVSIRVLAEEILRWELL